MFVKTDAYNYEKLKQEDKLLIDAIEETKEDVLSSTNIEDFIETKSPSGKITKMLYQEVLTEFTEFLKERCEYHKIDKIIEKVDNYI